MPTTSGYAGPMAKEPTDIVKLEREVAEMLLGVPPEVVGGRFRRARQRMGLSIRDVAIGARVSKNSVVRLEHGGTPHPLTVVKLCAALGIHVASLAKPLADSGAIVAIHRAEDDRWYDLTDFGAGPLADRPLSPEERRQRAQDGVQVPLMILSNRLETGRLLPTVIELYRESELRSHPGEELVYVLEGSAQIRVGPDRFVLNVGESATFWSSEEHSYAPAEGTPLPARVLSVRIDDGR